MSRIAINKKKLKISLILKRLLVIVILFILLVFSYIFLQTHYKLNFISNYIESISKKYDYVFTEVEINGLTNISRNEINKYLKEYINKSIFLIPIYEISNDIKNNPWIELLTIKNDFKSKITINVKEFVPVAIYFDGVNYLLINDLGNLIDYAKEEKFRKLIILKGKNSNQYASNLIKAIPIELKSDIIEVHYINNRRWDLLTKKNLRILLPEINFTGAMNAFIDIYADIYSSNVSNIEYIDLRIPKKMIIRYQNENKSSQ